MHVQEAAKVKAFFTKLHSSQQLPAQQVAEVATLYKANL
jgi:hypothetical protein